MKKKWMIISAIALVFLVGGYFIFKKKTPVVQTYEVSKKDLVQTVSTTGELKADTRINLNFETTGRIKEIKAVVDKTVAQGEALASLDDQDLNSQLADAKAALDKANAQSGISQDEVARLVEKEAHAKKYLGDMEDLEDQKVKSAKQDVDSDQKYFDDTQDYYDKVVSQDGKDSKEAKTAKLNLDTAEDNLKDAKQNEEIAEQTRDLNITSAKNSLRSAQDELQKAQSESQQNFDQATVAAAQAQYDLALHALDKSSLKAPVNGKITQINYKKGEVLGSASTLSFGQMMSSDLLIEANVAESDIAKLRVGNQAQLTFDSLGDEQKFSAEIISIDPASTVIQEVVYYLVKFKLDSSFDARLKPGMTANIDVEATKKIGIIAIPERLVKEDNGTKYVDILGADNKSKRAEIKLGLRGDEGMIEVLSGLKEGDRVVQ